MKTISIIVLVGAVIAVSSFSFTLNAQSNMKGHVIIGPREKSIISIAALTSKGDLAKLKPALNHGLDAGLTVNQVKEVLVHLYAYCGFPRSIRGLQTFMEVIDERRARGIIDKPGPEASPIKIETSKYERGKQILSELTKSPQLAVLTGYSAFAPVIDTLLKEHLFADLFERDVLTYTDRELVTISVLSSIGGVEPMLRSHLTICLNLGLTPDQLTECTEIIKEAVGKKEAEVTQSVINEVLGNLKDFGFTRGQLLNSPNFTGAVWLNMMGAKDSTLHASVGNVTFEPRARTNWHSHPGGQILFITEGKGYYQVKGQPVRLLQKGDYVEIPSNVVHWHGASPTIMLAHIAVSLNTDRGGAVWFEPVTDEEYNKCSKQ